MLASERTTTVTNKPFDPLAYAKRLEKSGHFTREQAELLAEEQANLIDERLATKFDIECVRADIEQLRLSTKADIEQLRLSTKADIEQLRLSTKADIEQLRLSTKTDIEQLRFAGQADLREVELRMTVRLGGMIMALGGILIAIKYFG